VIVKIEWNEKWLKGGDPTITKQKLLRTKWNPDKPSNGAWREELYHKVQKEIDFPVGICWLSSNLDYN